MSGGSRDNRRPNASARRGWMIIAVLAVVYLLWCALIYLAIGERERTWLYGDVPDIPGESIHSVEPVPGGLVPPQPLPQDPFDESPVLQRDPLPPPLSPAAGPEVTP